MADKLFEAIKAALKSDEDLNRSDIRLTQISSLPHLKFKLDDTVQINEIHVSMRQSELIRIGKELDTLGKKVATEEMSKQEKLSALRQIRRLKKQENSLTNILRIRQDNVDVHISLLNKIAEMESMGKKALIEPVIDELQVEYEEQLGNHNKFVDSVKVLEEQIGYQAQVEDSELSALEKELIAQYNPEKAKELELTEEKSSPQKINTNQAKIDAATQKLIDLPPSIPTTSPSPLKAKENKVYEDLKKEEEDNKRLEEKLKQATEKVRNSRSVFEEELDKALKKGRDDDRKERQLEHA